MLDVEVSPIISYTEGGKELDDGLNKLEEQKRVRESEREKWKEELARQSKE